MKETYVFGPVPSRRLGRSLGVDLIPHKTCPFDCTYCQVGRTSCHTIERREWVPLDEVLAQLRAKLSTYPDFVTLAGSGEPTLHSRLGEFLEETKKLTDVPVAVLTNGALMPRPDVREDLRLADLVVPSLDAGDEETYHRVNRPHPSLSFDKMVEGLVEFRRTCSGKYWLEVLLLGGITDTPLRVGRIAEIARSIAPDRVQLNTATRPPADKTALTVPRERLERLARLFGGEVEIIASYKTPGGASANAAVSADDVLALYERHPATVAEAAISLGCPEEVATQHTAALEQSGELQAEERDGAMYYMRKA